MRAQKQGQALRSMLQLTMFAAIIMIMAIAPFLGYIPLTPTIRATTIHIPVILGAMLLGPRSGALLGALFGLTSLISNTLSPNITSFVFTPFYQVGEVGGNAWSLVICFVPRILAGVVAGVLFQWMARYDSRKVAACMISAVAGSLTNTIFVMGGIYLFFGQSYANAMDIPYHMLLSMIIGVIMVNGMLEALVAAVLVTLVARPLLHVFSTAG